MIVHAIKCILFTLTINCFIIIQTLASAQEVEHVYITFEALDSQGEPCFDGSCEFSHLEGLYQIDYDSFSKPYSYVRVEEPYYSVNYFDSGIWVIQETGLPDSCYLQIADPSFPFNEEWTCRHSQDANTWVRINTGRFVSEIPDTVPLCNEHYELRLSDLVSDECEEIQPEHTRGERCECYSYVDIASSRFDCRLFEDDSTTVQEDILFCDAYALPTRQPIGPRATEAPPGILVIAEDSVVHNQSGSLVLNPPCTEFELLPLKNLDIASCDAFVNNAIFGSLSGLCACIADGGSGVWGDLDSCKIEDYEISLVHEQCSGCENTLDDEVCLEDSLCVWNTYRDVCHTNSCSQQDRALLADGVHPECVPALESDECPSDCRSSESFSNVTNALARCLFIEFYSSITAKLQNFLTNCAPWTLEIWTNTSAAITPGTDVQFNPPTRHPSPFPSFSEPSELPTAIPTTTSAPTFSSPSIIPSCDPSCNPSDYPSTLPSEIPSQGTTTVEMTTEAPPVSTSLSSLPPEVEVYVLPGDFVGSVFSSGIYSLSLEGDSWVNQGCLLSPTVSGFTLLCGSNLATIESTEVVPPTQGEWMYGSSKITILTKSELSEHLFEWSVDSTCSVTCGAGILTNVVTCEDTNSGDEVDSWFCDAETREEDRTVCPVVPCPPSPAPSFSPSDSTTIAPSTGSTDAHVFFHEDCLLVNVLVNDVSYFYSKESDHLWKGDVGYIFFDSQWLITTASFILKSLDSPETLPQNGFYTLQSISPSTQSQTNTLVQISCTNSIPSTPTLAPVQFSECPSNYLALLDSHLDGIATPCIHAISPREECSESCTEFLTSDRNGVTLSEAYYHCEIALANDTAYVRYHLSFTACFGNNAECSAPVIDFLVEASSQLYSVCFFALLGQYCTTECLIFLDDKHDFMRRCLSEEDIPYAAEISTLLDACYPEWCFDDDDYMQTTLGTTCSDYIREQSCLLVIGGRYVAEICCSSCENSFSSINETLCPSSLAYNGTILSLGFSQASLPSSLNSHFQYEPRSKICTAYVPEITKIQTEDCHDPALSIQYGRVDSDGDGFVSIAEWRLYFEQHDYFSSYMRRRLNAQEDVDNLHFSLCHNRTGFVTMNMYDAFVNNESVASDNPYSGVLRSHIGNETQAIDTAQSSYLVMATQEAITLTETKTEELIPEIYYYVAAPILFFIIFDFCIRRIFCKCCEDDSIDWEKSGINPAKDFIHRTGSQPLPPIASFASTVELTNMLPDTEPIRRLPKVPEPIDLKGDSGVIHHSLKKPDPMMIEYSEVETPVTLPGAIPYITNTPRVDLYTEFDDRVRLSDFFDRMKNDHKNSRSKLNVNDAREMLAKFRGVDLKSVDVMDPAVPILLGRNFKLLIYLLHACTQETSDKLLGGHRTITHTTTDSQSRLLKLHTRETTETPTNDTLNVPNLPPAIHIREQYSDTSENDLRRPSAPQAHITPESRNRRLTSTRTRFTNTENNIQETRILSPPPQGKGNFKRRRSNYNTSTDYSFSQDVSFTNLQDPLGRRIGLHTPMAGDSWNAGDLEPLPESKKNTQRFMMKL